MRDRVAEAERDETLTELVIVLERTAERIIEEGTATESRTLHAMAAAAHRARPGAAAALVDWSGSEIARLRAFGVVHGVVVSDLGRADRSRLLHHILGRADLALAG